METNPGGGFSLGGMNPEGGGAVLGDGTVGDVQPDSLVTTLTPYGFGGAWGYMTDPSGAIQLGARFYWPSLGRFIQQDPAGDGINWYAYVGNNPITGIDPEGRRIRLTGDIEAYKKATAYLRQAPLMAQIIDYLEDPRTPLVRVHAGPCSENKYSPGGGENGKVLWNPHLAVMTTGGGYQSPAMGLGHELGHAALGPGLVGWLEKQEAPYPNFTNLAEYHNIRWLETPTAEWLGEGTRFDHYGTPCTGAPTVPTSQ